MIKRAVVYTDFSATASKVLDVALQIAKENYTSIEIIHVLKNEEVAMPMCDDLVHIRRKSAQRRISELAVKCFENKVECNARLITEAQWKLESHLYDVAYIGTQGKGLKVKGSFKSGIKSLFKGRIIEINTDGDFVISNQNKNTTKIRKYGNC